MSKAARGRAAHAHALSEAGDTADDPWLAAALVDRDANVRRLATALVKLRDPAACRPG